MVEERQIPYYSVLDFISQTEKKATSIGTLLKKFNLSHTTISTLCMELKDIGFLKIEECTGENLLVDGATCGEKIYCLTPIGEDIVKRFNGFFCYVLDNVAYDKIK